MNVLIAASYKRIIYDYIRGSVVRAAKVCYLYPLFYTPLFMPPFFAARNSRRKGDVILISWLESSIGRLCGLISLWAVDDNRAAKV